MLLPRKRRTRVHLYVPSGRTTSVHVGSYLRTCRCDSRNQTLLLIIYFLQTFLRQPLLLGKTPCFLCWSFTQNKVNHLNISRSLPSFLTVKYSTLVGCNCLLFQALLSVQIYIRIKRIFYSHMLKVKCSCKNYRKVSVKYSDCRHSVTKHHSVIQKTSHEHTFITNITIQETTILQSITSLGTLGQNSFIDVLNTTHNLFFTILNFFCNHRDNCIISLTCMYKVHQEIQDSQQ